jgi:YVTN family beta-propeller protein
MKVFIKLALFLFTIITIPFQVIADSTVYVPLGSADKILVIDGLTDQAIRKIDGTPDVHGLAVTPDGKRLIAGSYAEVLASQAKAPEKPKGMSKTDHHAHHAEPLGGKKQKSDGISYVSVIRTKDSSIIRRIEVPGAVHHVSVTRGGEYAVVTHPDYDSVSMIDLKSYKVAKTIKTGKMPNYAISDLFGSFVYVSNAGEDTISEIDLQTWKVSRRIKVGKRPEHMAISHNGKYLFVNNIGDGSVSSIVLPKGIVRNNFKIGGKLHGIDLSADGQTLFVSAREKQKLFAIDWISAEMRSVPLAPSPYHVTAIPGTEKLYVSSAEESKLWVIDQASLKKLREIKVTGEGHQMVVVR